MQDYVNKTSLSNKQREVWIDWAKAIGIAVVVFCHIPQGSSFFHTFCCYLQMPLFFFISGYLHKNQMAFRPSLAKYVRAIVIPYLILQLLNYPYWLFKHYSEVGVDGLYNMLVLPFVDCFLAKPIAGPTWYICSVLLLKLLSDAMHRVWPAVKGTKCSTADHVTFALVVLTMLCSLYINRYPIDHNMNFALLSTINFLPFFYLGYYVKRWGNVSRIGLRYGMLAFLLFIGIYFLERNMLNQMYDLVHPVLLQQFLFYAGGLLALMCFLSLMHCFKRTSGVVEVISRGTILILGLHWMFIGTCNYVLEKQLGITDILYSLTESVVLALVICFLLYFFILFCMKYFKMALGGR